MRDCGDGRHVRHRPDQVGGRRDGDEPGPVTDHGRDSCGVELSGCRIELGPADRRADRLGSQHPRSDVRVVVEAADHHLVPRAPVLRKGPRHLEGQRRHAPPEDHPRRVRAQQVTDRRPGLEHRSVGVAFRLGHLTPGRHGGGELTADRVGHRLRGLGAARSVEVRCPALQRGELGPEGLDVERGGGTRAGTRSAAYLALCHHRARGDAAHHPDPTFPGEAWHAGARRTRDRTVVGRDGGRSQRA